MPSRVSKKTTEALATYGESDRLLYFAALYCSLLAAKDKDVRRGYGRLMVAVSNEWNWPASVRKYNCRRVQQHLENIIQIFDEVAA